METGLERVGGRRGDGEKKVDKLVLRQGCVREVVVGTGGGGGGGVGRWGEGETKLAMGA